MARDGYDHVLTAPPPDELRDARARIASLERLRDRLAECNALAQSMGYESALHALESLRAMKRGPRPLSSEDSGG